MINEGVLYGILKLEIEFVSRLQKKESAIGRPWERKFLGFSFYTRQEEIRVRIHPKAIERVREKIRLVTLRNYVWSIEFRYLKLIQLIIGLVSFLG